MRAVPIAEGPVELRGALGADRTDAGLVPRRLPDWTRPRIPDAFMAFVVAMSSGVRLALRTTSTRLELDFAATGLRVAGEARWPIAFDLVVDGALAGEATSDAGTTIVVDMGRQPYAVSVEPGAADTVRFEGLAPGWKTCELWLPHAASIELRALRVDDGAEVAPPPPPRARWVHYGSSISHCLEADRPTGTWPVVAARRAGVEVWNLGFAGQCHLDGFVARTIRDLEADAISAKVGINVVNADSLKERTFVPALHAFLDMIRERRPATPILLASPIACPVAEDHPGPTVRAGDRVAVLAAPPEVRPGSLTLRRVRELVAEVVAARRAAGDTALHLLDGLALFGPGDLADLPDGLHPNAAGYRRIGERFAAHAFGPGGAFAHLAEPGRG